MKADLYRCLNRKTREKEFDKKHRYIFWFSWDQIFSSQKDDSFLFPIRELSMVVVDIVKTHINTSCHYRYIHKYNILVHNIDAGTL